MPSPIRDVAKIGFAHHMLYPAVTRDAGLLCKTLLDFCQWPGLETLDCCLPYEQPYLDQLIPALRRCGKSICFACHYYPLRTLPLAARSAAQHAQCWWIMDRLIEQAAAIGAEYFLLGAGKPAFPDACPEDFQAFDAFCHELCAKLQPHGITALLEPFDYSIDKCFLYGPIDDCIRLADRILKHHDNFGFCLDMAHLPLMQEDVANAIRRSAPYTRRVHLGNCVLRDKQHPAYGDMHPPMGLPGGEIDVPELTLILRELVRSGYLSTSRRRELVLEITPFPELSPEASAADNLARLDQAWAAI